ncbi:hypothetical protein FB446DRAFT_654994 [Lentinula raphanica]|nr:hypothetical protein FB446DRAFT_654994 [Lentinula raphanica]
MHKPMNTHWKAVLWIYKYLNSMLNYILVLGGKELTDIFMFTDAGYALQIDQCLISDYVSFIGDGPIS